MARLISFGRTYFVFCVFTVFSSISLADVLHSLKREAKAATGACLAPVRSIQEAKEILKRNRIKVGKKANHKQIISLAVGLQQIELLAGGPAEIVAGAFFKFPKRLPYSRQTPMAIEMGANHVDGNVGHLMHELGHYVGNQGFYELYRANVGICHFTNYCKVHYSKSRYRNEEFAETWAAFITHPELLKNSDQRGCREAFEFFSAMFGDGSKFAVCDRQLLTKAIRFKRINEELDERHFEALEALERELAK